MSKEIMGLAEFGAHLAEIAIAEVEFLNHGLEHVAKLVEAEARAEFGVYQPQTGPFPAWPELADSTKEQRLDLGFTENDPLLRTGKLRDSIGHEVHGLDAVVGSASDLMVYHEFGTSRMPARPVLGPAVFRHRDKIEALIGEAAVLGIAGARVFAVAEHREAGQLVVHEDAGYDYETF